MNVSNLKMKQEASIQYSWSIIFWLKNNNTWWDIIKINCKLTFLKKMKEYREQNMFFIIKNDIINIIFIIICWKVFIRIPKYFRACLVAQLVKNSSAMWETWIRSLGWEDPLEKGKATHSSILAWRIPWTVYPWGHKESDMSEQISLHFKDFRRSF